MIKLAWRLTDVEEDGDADEAQSHFPRDSTESRHRFQRSYVPARRSGRVESDEARDAPERRERDIVGSSSCVVLELRGRDELGQRHSIFSFLGAVISVAFLCAQLLELQRER